MTISSNVMKPFIINGKPLKSINQYYNKQKSKYDLLNLSKKELIKLERLNLKRENKINDYIHKSTRILVNHLVSNNIDTLIIGQNIGWKQDINIGKRTKRGLFRTSTNKYINADLNGSLNILKKYLIKNVAWNDTIWSDLVEANSKPNILILTPSFN